VHRANFIQFTHSTCDRKPSAN